MPSQSNSPVRTAATLAFIALICAAPLAVGGTRVPIKLILCGLAGLALVGVLATRRGDSPRLPWPIWPPVLLVVWYAIALIPLPAGLLSALSPHAAAIREGAGPLSLDAPATAVGLILQAGFVATLIAAACVDNRRQRWVLIALAGIGGVIAAVGLLHWGTGTPRIFGLIAPADRANMSGYFSTFVNNNTLAGLAVFSCLIALGLVARARDDALRMLALGCALLSMLAAVLSGSRGGQAALLLGLLIFAGATRLADPEQDAVKRARAVAGVGLALAILGVAAAILILPDWQQTAFTTPTADMKIAAWGPAVDYAADFWATGSGRDTFEYVYPRYQTLAVRNTISHPENIVLQLACEGGLVAVIVGIGGALGALGFLLGDLRRGSALDWGLIAGLIAVSVQQIVDFGFESAGLSLPVAAGFGVALSRAARRRSSERSPRTLRAALVGGAVLVIGVAVFGPGLPAKQADAEVAAWRLRPANTEALRSRHPADGLLPLVVAAQTTSAGQVEAALPWITRAQRATPNDPRPHLIAARLFVDAGRPGQAASEYRRAYQKGPWMAANIAREASRLKATRHLDAALPNTPDARRHLATALLGTNRAVDLRRLMDEAILLRPEDASAHTARARACVALSDKACVDQEVAWLSAHEQPTVAQTLRARAASKRGDVAESHAALAALGPLADLSPEHLRLTVNVALRLKDSALAKRALALLTDRTRADPIRTAAVYALEAKMHRRFGDPKAALTAAVRAQGLVGSATRAVFAAQMAVEAGRKSEARRMLNTAKARWPRARNVQSALDALGDD